MATACVQNPETPHWVSSSPHHVRAMARHAALCSMTELQMRAAYEAQTGKRTTHSTRPMRTAPGIVEFDPARILWCRPETAPPLLSEYECDDSEDEDSDDDYYYYGGEDEEDEPRPKRVIQEFAYPIPEQLWYSACGRWVETGRETSARAVEYEKPRTEMRERWYEATLRCATSRRTFLNRLKPSLDALLRPFSAEGPSVPWPLPHALVSQMYAPPPPPPDGPEEPEHRLNWHVAPASEAASMPPPVYERPEDQMHARSSDFSGKRRDFPRHGPFASAIEQETASAVVGDAQFFPQANGRVPENARIKPAAPPVFANPPLLPPPPSEHQQAQQMSSTSDDDEEMAAAAAAIGTSDLFDMEEEEETHVEEEGVVAASSVVNKSDAYKDMLYSLSKETPPPTPEKPKAKPRSRAKPKPAVVVATSNDDDADDESPAESPKPAPPKRSRPPPKPKATVTDVATTEEQPPKPEISKRAAAAAAANKVRPPLIVEAHAGTVVSPSKETAPKKTSGHKRPLAQVHSDDAELAGEVQETVSEPADKEPAPAAKPAPAKRQRTQSPAKPKTPTTTAAPNGHSKTSAAAVVTTNVDDSAKMVPLILKKMRTDWEKMSPKERYEAAKQFFDKRFSTHEPEFVDGAQWAMSMVCDFAEYVELKAHDPSASTATDIKAAQMRRVQACQALFYLVPSSSFEGTNFDPKEYNAMHAAIALGHSIDPEEEEEDDPLAGLNPFEC